MHPSLREYGLLVADMRGRIQNLFGNFDRFATCCKLVVGKVMMIRSEFDG